MKIGVRVIVEARVIIVGDKVMKVEFRVMVEVRVIIVGVRVRVMVNQGHS
jgi:hypothetical protein